MCDKLNEQIEELKTRCKESMSEAELTEAELKLKCEVDLERQLKDCKAQYSEMYEELKRYKMTCDQLNEQNEEFKEKKEEFERRCEELGTQAESRLEKQLNDYKAKYGEMYVRFKEGKERMAPLERDLKEYMRICCELNEQVESSEDKLCKEIVHLGDEKREVEDESECLKTKFREQENKTALYLKELDDYKVKCHGLSVELKEKELEFVEYQNRKVFCEREKKAEERIVYLQEVVKSLVEEKCIQPKPFVNLNGDKGNAASSFKMVFANRANEKINLEVEQRKIAVFKQDNLKPAGIIQMCSKEDDKEIKPKHTCDTGSKQRLNVSTSKRRFFDQKGEEYGINYEAVDIPLSSAPKRERLPETKLKERTVSRTPNISSMNICAGDIALSSKCQIAEEYVANLRRKLASQKMCAEKKSRADGTSKVENTLPDCLEMGGRSSQDKVGSLTTENDGDIRN
ncbi:hypothetical protein MKX01_027570 [Papaver californicum]|nr:hypothetical protein MKX01_027570 [Papaver californicum]